MKRILVGLVALAATMNVAVAQVYPTLGTTEPPGDQRGSAAPPAPTTRMPVTMPASTPANPGDEPFDSSNAGSPDEALPPVIASPFVPPPVSLEQPLANLAVAALEPESPASFAANGVIADLVGEARILVRPAIHMTPVP